MIFYTNAPKRYDYGCTDELDPDVGRLTSGMDQDNPVRKIDIRGEGFHAETQIMRNSSGLYPTLTEEQWAEWLTLGFATGGDENSKALPDADDPAPSFDAHCAHCNTAARIDDLGTTCSSCGRGIIVAQTTTDSEPEEGE